MPTQEEYDWRMSQVSRTGWIKVAAAYVIALGLFLAMAGGAWVTKRFDLHTLPEEDVAEVNLDDIDYGSVFAEMNRQGGLAKVGCNLDPGSKFCDYLPPR